MELAEILEKLITTDWKQARERRDELEEVLLKLAAFDSMEDFLKNVAPQTTVVTIVGGAASRWDKSFDDPEGAQVAMKYGIVRGKSRFLALVPNLLTNTYTGERIPILAYNLYGVRNLVSHKAGAAHVLIYGQANEVNEIKDITTGAGIQNSLLLKQEIRPGKEKPFGHADALLQHLEVITGRPYVVTHFGGDVTSASTIELSLLCQYVLHEVKAPVDVILPTTMMEVPKYPVFIDANGLPRQFGHEKLLGKESLHTKEVRLSPGGSNIGLRIYESAPLKLALTTLAPIYETREEFALDHVDQYFAEEGRVRQLAIGLPEEISHAAKSLNELLPFLENEAIVLADQ